MNFPWKLRIQIAMYIIIPISIRNHNRHPISSILSIYLFSCVKNILINSFSHQGYSEKESISNGDVFDALSLFLDFRVPCNFKVLSFDFLFFIPSLLFRFVA